MKKEHKKILGFDFGMKYIGVAFGQSLTKTATPIAALRAKDGIPDWNEIKDIIDKWQPDAIVAGIPVNMDGTEQQITFCAKKFANRLQEKFKLPVYRVDERLSTWEAKSKLKIHYKDKHVDKKQLDKVNALAASILIEQFFSGSDIS